MSLSAKGSPTIKSRPMKYASAPSRSAGPVSNEMLRAGVSQYNADTGAGRSVDREVRRTRRKRATNEGRDESERGARGEDENTRIQHPVQDVRDNVAEHHEERDEEEEGRREDPVVGRDRDEQVRAEPVVR